MSIKDLGQKIKGVAQQVKGEVEVQTGHPIRGNIDKLKGKTNVAVADVKMNIRKKMQK